jgi:hypothetical protein
MHVGNQKLQWMYTISDALYPSPYLIRTNNDTYNRGFVAQPILEAKRLAPSKPVYLYMWYRYLHTGAVVQFAADQRPCKGQTASIPNCLTLPLMSTFIRNITCRCMCSLTTHQATGYP